ncbi:hypothetical protein ACDX34_08335 [Acinetobacter bereziniae]|uniref:hypothetical protein n=1 Tax=Acinetobacter bereziniae TaxID=106648 RepID=UPI0039C1798A
MQQSRFDQTLNMFTGELDEDDVSFDANSNIVTFKLNQNKYCPMLVYKALMKIFYGLVPRNHLSKFEILRKWIINTDNNFIPFSPLNVYKSRLEGFGTNILDLIIFHKHVTNLEEFKECLPTEEDFEYLVQLRFGHIILEFPIFSDICYEKLLILKENNLPTKFNFPYIPKQGFPQIEETIDFSETRKIKNKESMYFSFDKFTKENID